MFNLTHLPQLACPVAGVHFLWMTWFERVDIQCLTNVVEIEVIGQPTRSKTDTNIICFHARKYAYSKRCPGTWRGWAWSTLFTSYRIFRVCSITKVWMCAKIGRWCWHGHRTRNAMLLHTNGVKLSVHSLTLLSANRKTNCLEYRTHTRAELLSPPGGAGFVVRLESLAVSESAFGGLFADKPFKRLKKI